jgi:hypothetical protein
VRELIAPPGRGSAAGLASCPDFLLGSYIGLREANLFFRARYLPLVPLHQLFGHWML